MIALIIIGIIIVLNISLCTVYCTYNRKRSVIVDTVHDFSDQKDAKTNKGNDNTCNAKVSLKRKIIRKVLWWLENILRYNLFIIAYIPSHHIRNFLYKYEFKVQLKKNAIIYYGAEIRAPWNLVVGEGTIIGDCAKLDARSGIIIGKNVNFSTGVWIWTLQHGANAVDFGVEGEGNPVFIGDRSWLSCRTVILPGINIGEGSVVAAGAVCTKDTDPFSINGGIPCKKIGERNSSINYVFDGTHMHFL